MRLWLHSSPRFDGMRKTGHTRGRHGHRRSHGHRGRHGHSSAPGSRAAHVRASQCLRRDQPGNTTTSCTHGNDSREADARRR